MPEHLSITLNNTVHHFNYVVSVIKFLLPQLCNKYTTVLKEPDYPSNRSHLGVMFLLQAHCMVKCAMKVAVT